MKLSLPLSRLARLLAGFAAGTAVLTACTWIEGDRITGADLASENLGFSAIDPALDLGPAPLAGTDRVMRAAELGRLAEKYGIALLESAPPEACFRRATQVLSAQMLQPILEEALTGVPEAAEASIEIVDFNRHELPLGYAEFEPDGLSSSGLWRGRLVYAESRSVPIWARVRIAKPDGTAVAMWKTFEEPVIKPGDTVRVRVQSGGILLAFDAAAQGSGHVGETILVRNPENGRRFRATIDAPGKVSIQP